MRAWLRLAHRRLTLWTIVVVATLAVAPLANEAPPACNENEPGVDVMSCAGVQRSLMQTGFMKSTQLEQEVAAPSASEMEAYERSGPPTAVTLITQMQLPSAAVLAEAPDKGTVAGEPPASLMQQAKPSAPVVDNGALLLEAERVDSKLASNVGVVAPQNSYEPAFDFSRGYFHVTLTEMASWRSTITRALHEASENALSLDAITSRGTALPYIMFAAVVLFVLLTCACAVSLLMSDDEENQSPKSRGSLPTQRPAALMPPDPVLPHESPGQSRMATKESIPNISSSLAKQTPRSPPQANSGRLCPGLMVPPGHECVLVVRTFASAAGQRSDARALMLDVLDLHGKKVLGAQIASEASIQTADPGRMSKHGPELWKASHSPALPPTNPRLPPSPAFMTLLTPGQSAAPDASKPTRAAPTRGAASKGAEDLAPSLGSVLSECRFDGSGGLNVYNAFGELFGTFTRDLARPRYSFVGRGEGRNDLRMYFDGIFHDHTTIVTNENVEQLADTEPTAMPSDPQGKYYKVRVCASVDVGLVLSGLLVIDAMEA